MSVWTIFIDVCVCTSAVVFWHGQLINSVLNLESLDLFVMGRKSLWHILVVEHLLRWYIWLNRYIQCNCFHFWVWFCHGIVFNIYSDKAELCNHCCQSVCLSVCHSVSRITHEHVYGCTPNMVGMVKECSNFGVYPNPDVDLCLTDTVREWIHCILRFPD